MACLCLSAACFACNDTDDIHVGLRSSTFDCSNSSGTKLNNQAPDPMWLACASEVEADVREIALVSLGPTASTNIKGLHFQVVYPRDRFAYVAGSATMVPNNFLTWDGGTCNPLPLGVCTAGAVGKVCTSHAACNIPGANMPVVTASESLDPPADPAFPLLVNGRLTITIDRNPATGVGSVIGGPSTVLQFRMQTTSVTAPTDPTLFKFDNAMAVDPGDVKINSIVFRDLLYLWVQ